MTSFAQRLQIPRTMPTAICYTPSMVNFEPYATIKRHRIAFTASVPVTFQNARPQNVPAKRLAAISHTPAHRCCNQSGKQCPAEAR